MRSGFLPAIVTLVLLGSSWAFAQDGADTNPQSVWLQLLFNAFPILLLLGVWWFFYRRMSGPKYQSQVQRSVQHYERVEALLERIAQALERRP